MTGSSLLQADEPTAFEIVNPGGLNNLVLICDHASNRIPRALGNLGLNEQQLKQHISWDPGAADVARQIAQELDAPLLLSGYSRLVIDCNRPLQSPELIAKESAGVNIPGNRHLSLQEREQRVASLFHPYHQAIESFLDRRAIERANDTASLLSIHSFTPVLNDAVRPWHIGISHKENESFARLLYDVLRRDNSICVGYNQPYPIEDAFDYSIPNHGDKRGIASAMIEIRQDVIQTKADVASWAKRIARAYKLIES